ncbi:MAG: Crp/Fnr family transcriptional regulator [Thermodesulfovibrionales bacterium]
MTEAELKFYPNLQMNNTSEIAHGLRALPCLSGLRDEDLAAIEQVARLKRFGKNEIIFEELDCAKFLFIVVMGSVKLYKTSDEGRELIIKVIRQGDYFCCAPIYAAATYPVNAMSLEDSTLIEIPAADFKRMLRSRVGEMGLKIISGLCARIKYLSELVEDITFKDVEQRVIMALFRLSEERPFNEKIITLTVTHQDIASMTGTVREVVSRTMSRLKKEGIITGSSARGFNVKRERLLKLLSRNYPQFLVQPHSK